jgi:uncharacterized protein
LADARVLRGIIGFGETSKLHTNSILWMLDDIPIVVEVVGRKENIECAKSRLDEIIEEGLITEEEVRIVFYKRQKTFRKSDLDIHLINISFKFTF